MIDDQISIQLVQGPIDVPSASILPLIGCGGECVFIGRTRPEEHNDHGDLIALEYECYEEMAKKTLIELANESIQRFSIGYIRLTHSIGRVEVNAPSIVIAVSSKHRADAFRSCRFIIDLLKQRVPIWKQEKWSDGTTWSKGVPLTP